MLVCFPTYGQQDVVQSMDDLFSTTEDTTLMKVIDSVYKDNVELVPDLIDYYLTRPRKVKLDSTAIVDAYAILALSNRKIGNYVESIRIYKKVYDFRKIHLDSMGLAEAADQIGIMNTFMGNMHEAQGYLLEVANLYNRIGSKLDIAGANNGLAIFYNDIGNTEKAIEMYKLALQQYEEIDDTLGRANVHANLGLLYIDEDSLELAEQNILMQGHLDSAIQTQWGLGFFHDFMGMLKKRQGKLPEALKYFKQAYKIRETLPSHYNLAETNHGLAATYNAMKQYDKAITYANAILEHKDKHQSLSQEMNAYLQLSQAYEGKKMHKEALVYHKKYKLIADSIYSRDLLEEITHKDALFEKVKQDRKIETLSFQNELSLNKIKYKNKIILGGLVAILIILGLIYNLYRLYKKVTNQKEKVAQTLKEKDLLLREIHHRVKNNLQLISSLLTLQGRSINDENVIQAINEGKSRVRSMAIIHQDLYNRENLTGLSVRTYLSKLSKELFDTYNIDKDRIKLNTNIEDLELDIDTMVPLGLIINELITNSLKYAFPGNEKGEIFISLSEQDNRLKLRIEDNGIGYDETKINNQSFGSTLLRALTNQLNGTLTINSKNGTEVKIEIEDYKKTA